jgi:hypothetical protein
MCFKKLIFLKKKPKVIIVGGAGHSFASLAIFQVLRKFFKVAKISKSPSFKEIRENQILVFELSNSIAARSLKFWLKNSSQPILVITDSKELSQKELENLAKVLPTFGYLIVNFDDETARKLGDQLNVYNLTFGFNQGADLFATDCHFAKGGVTFKLNFKGNILPIWLPYLSDKNNILGVLAALSLSQVFNLNLVEVSQILKNWQGIDMNTNN